MMRFPSFRRGSVDVDGVPEESDVLVGALRQAYSSTPIPDHLLLGIGAAVRGAAVEQREAAYKSRLRLWPAGLVLAPACAIAVVVLVLSQGGTKSPNAVQWTRSHSLSVTADAVFTSPHKLRITYKAVPVVSKRSLRPIFGGVHGPTALPSNYSPGRARVMLTPVAYLGDLRLQSRPCGSKAEPSKDGHVSVCFRVDHPVAKNKPVDVLLASTKTVVFDGPSYFEYKVNAPQKMNSSGFAAPSLALAQSTPARRCKALGAHSCWLIRVSARR